MNLHIEYSLTKDDSLALARITCKNQYIASFRQTLRTAIFWILVLIAAAFSSYMADIIILLFLFIGVIAVYIFDLIQFRSRFWSIISQSLVTPKMPITIDLDDDGIREQSDGITSFAPWTTVTKIIDQKDHFFIELASRQWAIIPKQTLLPRSASIGDLSDLFKQKLQKAEQGA